MRSALSFFAPVVFVASVAAQTPPATPAFTPAPAPAPAPAPTPPAAGSIGYASVAAARQALESRGGVDTVVTHADGWTVVNEPMASAQWSFTPSGHAAYPAVVRRTIKRSPGGAVSVETASLCEAPEAECGKLLAEFATMNERIVQAVKARGRTPSQTPQ
ncbi:MAG: hypothetical protein U1F53_21085 [Burkholderiaceae bacterium]